eukprot:gnl/MRDRNA2_/MRDRNA2_86771_c0_seq14.p1 gnl/MRDRNA2_/MRDRNA2_86771_c0~~gnl/MRDRNA2_/MRDRNA2_86771_c0_seq14.p1  ORF type:complete len:1187 (+),score=-9.87 gnl/MRDRNA2_/MRDRNA2_86771_c0_seq14:338-3562(+)
MLYDDRCKKFFERLHSIFEESHVSLLKLTNYVQFFICCFNLIDYFPIKTELSKVTSLPIWYSLSQKRISHEKSSNTKYSNIWKHQIKRDTKMCESIAENVPLMKTPNSRLFASMIDKFCDWLIRSEVRDDHRMLYFFTSRYSVKFMEFLVDSISQIPSKCYIHTLLDDRLFLVKCRYANICREREGNNKFSRFVDLLEVYMRSSTIFFNGKSFCEAKLTIKQHEKALNFQKTIFLNNPTLKGFSLMNCMFNLNKSHVRTHSSRMSAKELSNLISDVLMTNMEEEINTFDLSFLNEVLPYYLGSSQSSWIRLKDPLFPTEHHICTEYCGFTLQDWKENCYALPKISSQFYSYDEYVVRHFALFQLETIQKIVVEVQKFMNQVQGLKDKNGNILIHGWSRNSVQILSSTLICSNTIGLSEKNTVLGEIVFYLNARPARDEWYESQPRELLLALIIEPCYNSKRMEKKVLREMRLLRMRCCTLVRIKNEIKNPLKQSPHFITPNQEQLITSRMRTAIVSYESLQYLRDREEGSLEIYSKFNFLLKRKARDDNSAALLTSIFELQTEDHSNITNLGIPKTTILKKSNMYIDMLDTFKQKKSIENIFPKTVLDYVENVDPNNTSCMTRFNLLFKKKSLDLEQVMEREIAHKKNTKNHLESKAIVEIKTERSSLRAPKCQTILTATQVRAILSSLNQGLTLIVGPPGSGKTDVLVRIVQLLYHNFPKNKTLICASSYPVLNNLFQKLKNRSVNSIHLLNIEEKDKLSHSVSSVNETSSVDKIFGAKAELLSKVERLGKALPSSCFNEVGYSCETSGYFWLTQILPRWKKFCLYIRRNVGLKSISKLFPFSGYFSTICQFFNTRSFERDLLAAMTNFHSIKAIFEELEMSRPLELLRYANDHKNYFLLKQSKIITMTCTQAGIKRQELIQLGFKYTNFILEDANQSLEIETYLQTNVRKQSVHKKLERIVLCGDYQQLPPDVRNVALRNFSNFDQSLFLRLLRIGLPYIVLDYQGRCRTTIAKLYNWRYRGLKNLPNVLKNNFKRRNPGFFFDYQLVNVPRFQGMGETETIPYMDIARTKL